MVRGMFATAAIALALVGTALQAQQKTTDIPGAGGRARTSPHVKAEWSIDGATVTVEYGRPYLKGRSEVDMMPPGQQWRTGADEPTTITSTKPIKIGTLTLAANTPHTINTVPGAQWELLVGKLDSPKPQWGIPYRKDLEVGRVPMTTGKTKAPVEQVTIHIDDTAAGATLRIEWGTASATVPFTFAS